MSSETAPKTRTRQAILVERHTPERAAGLVQATGNTSAPSDRQRKQATKVTKKTATKSRNARQSSATVSNAGGDEPANFRLSRVQKIVKMDNDSVAISRDAVYLLALAAEEMTRRIARATSHEAQSSDLQEIAVPDIARAVNATPSLSFLSDLIPPTVPMSQARQERELKDSMRRQNPRQSSIQRIHEQFRHLHATQPHKPQQAASTTSNSAAKAPNPREGRPMVNPRKSNGESRPTKASGLSPIAPGTKAFDYKNLPVPPAGMFFQVPPGVDRSNLRWPPLPSVQDVKAKPLSTTVNGGCMSTPVAGSTDSHPHTPVISPTPAREGVSAGQIGGDENPESLGVNFTSNAPDKSESSFDNGNLTGRTIYNVNDGTNATRGDISQEAKKSRRARTRASGAQGDHS